MSAPLVLQLVTVWTVLHVRVFLDIRETGLRALVSNKIFFCHVTVLTVVVNSNSDQRKLNSLLSNSCMTRRNTAKDERIFLLVFSGSRGTKSQVTHKG